jgi:ribosomal protein S12 methylthiotransferase accessory factor
MVSASMEAIELYAAESVAPAGVVSTYDKVRASQRLVPLAELPHRPHSVFAPHLPLSWSFGFDLLSGTTVAVPTELVTLGEPPELLSPFQRSSNGLASGVAAVEAVYAGLLEVIERDAVACQRAAARATGAGLPRVEAESLRALPLVRDLLDRLAAAQAMVVVYDCTVDTGVTVYLARLWDAAQRASGVYTGSGAHLDPQIAIVRAITEAAQSRTVYTAGTRDDLSRRAFVQHRAHASAAVVRGLLDQPATVDARVRAARSLASATFEADIRFLLGRLEAVGVGQCVVVDLTPPEFGAAVSVVRVVVPGLAGTEAQRGSTSPRAERFARCIAV